MVWFILTGMAAFAALAALWPVLRSSSSSDDVDAASSEAAFYKTQLDEIQRDVERGQLPESEAGSARAEAARRLIAVRSEAPRPGSVARWRNRLTAAVLIAIGLPAIAFPLYSLVGQPQMPDEPLANRHPASVASSDIEAAVAGVEAHLLAKPDDGKGWAVLAPVYMRLERYEDAARAYSEALRLLGEEPSRRASYGEALVAAAGGVVTDKARESFAKAVAEQPNQPQARFYLALAAEQEGKTADAIRAYDSLAADAPANAPWLGAVKSRLASLKGESPPAAAAAQEATADAPALGSPQQQTMIEGMVSRLATRLASGGGNIEEWSRLIRAYAVLHQADKAKSALVDARKALAPDANAVASLDALARDLGLGDAN
jgi:cytochrome c-type biogenesis protein CcmH